MKHIRNFGNGAVLGSMSLVVVSALTGCSEQKDQSINENKFIIVKELPTGKYEVISEEPTAGPTQVVVEQKDGTLKRLSQEEIKQIAQEEYKKVQEGTSEATQNNSGGMGLGSTILAVAAGSILGNMIANQLMGNKNFQRNNYATSSRARAFKREQAAKKSSSKKGFFSKSGSSSQRSGGFFGG